MMLHVSVSNVTPNFMERQMRQKSENRVWNAKCDKNQKTTIDFWQHEDRYSEFASRFSDFYRFRRSIKFVVLNYATIRSDNPLVMF